MGQERRYRAFISYSQQDAYWGERLHNWLETYRVPPGVVVEVPDPKKRRLGAFFRDMADMSAADDIAKHVRSHLENSDSLIVVCSPRSARSAWVEAEIQYFRAKKPAHKVLAVIIDGQPNSGDPDTECFPPSLRARRTDEASGALPIEPMGLDVRVDGRRKLCARLAAGLLEVPFDDLWKRQRRREMWQVARMSAGGLAVLATGAVLLFQNQLSPMWVKWTRYDGRAHAPEALAAMKDLAVFQDCTPGSSDCPEMVILPSGEFLLGSKDGDVSERDLEFPLQEASVPRIAVSRYEITFANWQACAEAGGCRTKPTPSDSGWGRGNRPVINITWPDAVEYADWLATVTGQPYRLLTDTEWEYAARSPRSPDEHTKFWWGDEMPACDPSRPNGAAFAECGGDEPTWPVGSFSPNRFGLYDVTGNVWEWVNACTRMETSRDGTREACAMRVYRGGSIENDNYVLPIATRAEEDPSNGDNDVGLRVGRDLAAKPRPN